MILSKADYKKTVSGDTVFLLVGVWRLELQASASRTQRATNCATPRYVLREETNFNNSQQHILYHSPRKMEVFFCKFLCFFVSAWPDLTRVIAAVLPHTSNRAYYRTNSRWIPLSRPSSVSSNMGISLPTSCMVREPQANLQRSSRMGFSQMHFLK